MAIPILSPLLWQAVPFGDPTAYLDFLGTHEQWHRELALVAGTRIVILDDLALSMDIHSGLHTELAGVLGVGGAVDLAGYDLEERESWETFMLVHGQEHERLRLAAGL